MLFFAVYFFQRRKGRVRLKKYIITTLILLLLIAGVVGMVLLRSGEGTPAQAAEFTPAPCTHETWADGACESCALRCVHRAWEEGLCTRCGWGCPHEQWLPNACARCGIACPHDVYDRDKHGCLRCGVELSHRYAGYRCEICDEPLEFETGYLPWELFAGSDRPGTVETLTYETDDYYLLSIGMESNASWEKAMCVYLPYGYDPARQYDVLVLLHGMGGTEEYWLLGRQEYYGPGTDKVRTKELLDNMIAQGLCKEMIVVTPCFYQVPAERKIYDRMIDQARFAGELQNIILPMIAETYSTYAADGSREALSAAREHFAFAGLSMGSIYGYNAVLPQCVDLFAWYGLFAGAECHTGKVAEALNAPENADHPIAFLYNAAGTNDSMALPHQGQYNEILSMTPGLTEGENAAFTWIEDAYHEYRAWGTGLYNFLRIAFH